MSIQQDTLEHILERLAADPMHDDEMTLLIQSALDDSGGSRTHRNTLYLILYRINTRRPFSDVQLEAVLNEALDRTPSCDMPLLAAA